MGAVFMTVLYVAILLAHGFVISVYALRMRHALAIGGMATAFGTASYLIVTNALAYVMDIQMAFFVGLVVLACITMCVLLPAALAHSLAHPLREISLPPRWLVFSLLTLILLCGFMGARFLGSDPDHWIHFPLAATIVEGNFPVMEVVNPWNRLGYHYGQAFLAAAFTSLTGFPLTSGYGFQPLLGVAGVILFSGSLAWSWTRSWWAVLIGSVLALFGGGLMWLKAGALIADLFQHFVTGPVLSVPFKNLIPSFSSQIVHAVVQSIGQRTVATGMPNFFGLIYCLEQAFFEANRRRTIAWFAVCLIFASALALTMEGVFVLFYPAIIVYVAVLSFMRWRGEVSDHSLAASAFFSVGVFAFAFLIARVQGGTLSASGADVNASAFLLQVDGYTEYHTWGLRVAFWQWLFLRDFGLPLLLMPFASVYWWRRRTKTTFPLFVLILGLGCLVAPFVVHYATLPGELKRLFVNATSLFALLIGVMLEQTLLSHVSRLRKVLGWILVAMMLTASSLYTVTRLTIPSFRFETAPLFATMPSITKEQRDLYAWAKAHSTIHDYFYLYSLDEPREDIPGELKSPQLERIRFMTYTGRYTIGAILSYLSMSEERHTVIRSFERSCDARDADVLLIRFIVTEDEERAAWFRSSCSPDDWKAVYDPMPAKGYPRIYERIH